MIVVMNIGASEDQVETVISELNEYGFDVHRSSGSQRSVLGAVGVKPEFDIRHLQLLDGVSEVHRVTDPYKFASRAWKQDSTQVRVGNETVGADRVVVMAGPCSVESEEQIQQCAKMVSECGGTILRGGAFKPRSAPHSFQGLAEPELVMMRDAAEAHDLAVVTEIIEPGKTELLARYADMLQIGGRNMQNYPLLKAVGQSGLPILLERGMSATIEEWLMSAEYILAENNPNVILCERGIRTFETSMRNTLDISAVPVVKAKSHLPVIVDPSNGLGLRNEELSMARAAIAAGADGLLIEVHPAQERTFSEEPQLPMSDQLTEMMDQIRVIAAAVGRAVTDPAVETG